MLAKLMTGTSPGRKSLGDLPDGRPPGQPDPAHDFVAEEEQYEYEYDGAVDDAGHHWILGRV